MSIGKYSPKPVYYRFWIVLVVLFMYAISGYAADYYSNPASNTGNFNANGVWALTPGGAPVNFPGTSHTFYITTGDNITIAANQTAGGIIVESGGTLTMSGNRTVTCPSVTINSGGLMALTTTRPTFTGDITNDGSITGTTARLTANTGTFTNNGTIEFGAGRITRSTGPLINSGSIILNTTGGQFTATTGSFTNTASGTLAITGTATVTLGTGDFVNDNTSASVNFGSSVVTISGTANQSIGGFTTTARFTASKTAGTTTITGDINSGGITKSGAGILDMGSGTHTTTGTVILTAGTMNGGSSTINANFVGAGAWQGTGIVFVPQTSTVNFGAGVAQSLTASNPQTFYNLTFSNNGLKTNTNTTVTNILSMEGDATASVAPTYGASATLRYNRSAPRTAGPEWIATFAASGGVIIDNTGAITTNGNKVFDLDSPLTINSGATLTPAAGDTFSFGGDLVNNGTWTPSDGALTITLTRDPQSIGSFSTTGLVSMTKASGDATFIGNVNGGGLTINGGGRLFLGFGLTHVFTGDWTSTAGILRGNTSTMQIGGNGIVTAGTFVGNNSTVDFNGTGAQNIPAFTYNNLTTSTGSTKTLLGNTIITNVLTINPGTTLAASSFILELSADGTPFVNNGTFTEGTSTVLFSGAGAQNIPGLTYHNLNTATGNTKTLQGTTTVGNVLTIGASTTLAAGANTINLSLTGTPLVVTGTFTAGTSTVNFNGAGAQNIAAQTYYNLNTSTGGTKTLQGTTTVSNVLTINASSTLAASSFTLNLSGTGTPFVNSGTFTAGTSTVSFNGAGAQNIPGLTYYNLNTATGNTKTLQGTTTVSNVLTINASTTLDLGSVSLTISGAGTPLVNSGTFTAGTSTVNFSNAGSVNIPALNYNNLNITGGARVLANSGTIGIANVFTPGAGAFTVTGSTVDFNGVGAQTIPAFTFNGLVLSGTGAKTIPTTITVSVNEIDILNGPTLDIEGTAAINITKP